MTISPKIHTAAYALLLFLSGSFLYPQPVDAATDACLNGGCHSEIKQATVRHQPVDEDCLSCHQQHQQNHPADQGADFTLTGTLPDLCYQCHDAPEDGQIVHAPIREGECTACHQVHGGSRAFLLITAQEKKELCLSCHDGNNFTPRIPHGPVGVGNCTLCHQPHASSHEGLLRDSQDRLCAKCHETLAIEIKTSKFVHTAIVEQQCSACHAPHGSDFAHLLKQQAQEICFSCHTAIGATFMQSKTRHGGSATENLCQDCHNTHASDTPKLLKSDQTTLCLSCHDKAIPATPEQLRNIKEEITDKPHMHAPLTEEGCSGCHNPHGSRYPDLLNGNYPDSVYAPFQKESYSFCFTCHDDQLVLVRETEDATGFRNGTINLHFLHVNKPKKGRTCRTCHSSHASDVPVMISSGGVPFGSWKIPLRYEQFETGGSCAPGCHRKLEYNRDNAVNYESIQ